MPIFCEKCGFKNTDTSKFCKGCGGEVIATGLDGTLMPGVKLDNRYEIKGLIKSGGMGSVYEALDHRFNMTICAVKEMLNLTTDPANQKYFIERFKEESQILRSLRHPGMPTVIDYFVEAGRYYLVMDYIEGKDLDTVMRSYGREGVPEKIVVEWAKELLDVLDYLHNQSPPIVYRDLKPGNVMLRSSDEKIMLIDFGIARVIITGTDSTKTGIGTPVFAPKELLMGRPEIKSDIYCVGSTMHCLLTGVVPVIPCDFKPLREHNLHISRELEAIVMKALSMNIEDRYRSAKEMKYALENIVSIQQKTVPSFQLPPKTELALSPPPPSVEQKPYTLPQDQQAVRHSPVSVPAPVTPHSQTEVVSIPHQKTELVKEPSKRKSSKVLISVITGLVILLLVAGLLMKNYMNNMLKKQANNTPTPIPVASVESKNYVETFDGVSFDMIYIEGGTFQMGSNNGDEDEKPVHSVTVSGFYMEKCEVTNKEYCLYKTSHENPGDTLPVGNVSWEDAVEYCKWLSEKTGNNYRLPTESEWEFACRAGSTTEYYWGNSMNDSYCWYNKNSNDQVHPVGEKMPNKFGLYDMSGNVFEWCSDCYGAYPSGSITNPTGPGNGSFRVNRGGGWNDYADYCRSADRRSCTPDARIYYLGFRLCRSAP